LVATARLFAPFLVVSTSVRNSRSLIATTRLFAPCLVVSTSVRSLIATARLFAPFLDYLLPFWLYLPLYVILAH